MSDTSDPVGDDERTGGDRPDDREIPAGPLTHVPAPPQELGPTRRPATRALGAVARRLPIGSLPYRIVDRLERVSYARESPARGTGRDRTVVRIRGHLRTVAVERQLETESMTGRNLDFVIESLRAAGLEPFVTQVLPGGRSRVGLPREQASAGLRALVAAAGDDPIYLSAPRRPVSPRIHEDLLVLSAPLAGDHGCPVVSIHHRVFDPDAHTQVAAGWACELAFWADDGAGGLIAEDGDPVSSEVPAVERRPAELTTAAGPQPSFAPFTLRRTFDVTFPVDAVYLWVDGSDPAWQARRAAAMDEVPDPVHTDAGGDQRFRQHDELRYSLRSLERHAPWIRHVYLVTDQQVPGWLDTTSGDITVVDHGELFAGGGVAPSFNSHALHSRLHHIDGLADHYLYLNDDVLFGRAVTPSDFFHSNGTSQFFTSRATIPAGPILDTDPPVTAARKRVRDLVVADFGAAPAQAMQHTPVPQQRQLMLELEERFPEEFARTASNRFRDQSDIEPGWLHHYYGYHLGRTVPGTIRYGYFNVGTWDAISRLPRLLETRGAQVFCLNDDQGEVPLQVMRDAMQELLDRYFPRPGRFEIDAPPARS